jgi:hypothetical protein
MAQAAIILSPPAIPGEQEAPRCHGIRLRCITIERDRLAVDRFNGRCFSPIETHWIAFFKLVDDPVEYSVANIKAASQRQAHSLALILIREKGIDVRKDGKD